MKTSLGPTLEVAPPIQKDNIASIVRQREKSTKTRVSFMLKNQSLFIAYGLTYNKVFSS